MVLAQPYYLHYGDSFIDGKSLVREAPLTISQAILP